MSLIGTETAIMQRLTADAAFSDPLTGGIYLNVELSRQVTPDAFDENSELRPCCLIRSETTTPRGGVTIPGAATKFVNILVYQGRGSDIVQACLERAYTLLHRQYLPGAGAWEIVFTDLNPNLPDGALNARYGSVRFACTFRIM